MIKRVFWFLVGAGVAAFVAIKIRDYLQQATPEAIGSRVADSAAGITERAQDFADRVRAAMVEREAEINDALGRNPE